MASTNEEQMFLELVNAARLDPLGDATRYISSYAAQATSGVANINSALSFFQVNGTLLLQQLSALTPAQPLAWNEQLAAAARAHNAVMIANNVQSHHVVGQEENLGPRVIAQGYSFSSLGENIFAFTEDPLQGHAGFMVDWGGPLGGMQDPAGHRLNIMSSNFREVGIGVTADNNGSNSVGPLVITQDFGTRQGSGTLVFILGVAYTDTSGDDFYSLGEGQAGLNVALSGGGSSLSEASGGYTLQTSSTGARTLTLTGATLSGAVTFNTTLAAGMNIKLDIVDGNTLQTSVSGTVGGAVTIVQGLGLTGLVLTAGDGAQTLRGTKGNDTLNGGTGADILAGGLGNDILVVNSTLDVVTEAPNAGTDLVRSTATAHTLAANVENLTLLGTGNINGTGNTGSNVLTGNSGNNVLNGASGADTLIGGAGDDTYVVNSVQDVVTEGPSAGTDLVQSTATSHTLRVNVENLVLLGTGNINGSGNTGNNVLTGNAGNNVLNGGAGTDTASYASATAGVTVNLALVAAQNTVGAGADTLTSIEKLTGSAFNDKLTGNGNANTLDGVAGNDVLNGGGGNDVLVGGLGADAYFFNTALGASNIDQIVGYSVVADTIRLENAIFTSLATPGVLIAANFRAGAGIMTAADADDFIILNTTTGALYYDANGSAAGAAVQFATLTGAPAGITEADFLVV